MELLPLILRGLPAADLVSSAASCSTLKAVVTDPWSDATLWVPACQMCWAKKAVDPMLVYPWLLAYPSHRERYRSVQRLLRGDTPPEGAANDRANDIARSYHATLHITG